MPALWTSTGGVDAFSSLPSGSIGESFTAINDGSGCTASTVICGTAIVEDGDEESVNGGKLQLTGCGVPTNRKSGTLPCGGAPFAASGEINADGTMVANRSTTLAGSGKNGVPQVIEWSGTNLPATPAGLSGYESFDNSVSGGDWDFTNPRWINDKGDLIVGASGGLNANGNPNPVTGYDLYVAAKRSVKSISGPSAKGAAVYPYGLDTSDTGNDTVVGGWVPASNATGDQNNSTAFEWTPSGGMTNLITVTYPQPGVSLSDLCFATGIGNNGDILALGSPYGNCNGNGASDTTFDFYLLTPSPVVVTDVEPYGGPLKGDNTVKIFGGPFTGPDLDLDYVDFDPMNDDSGDLAAAIAVEGTVVSDDEIDVTAPNATDSADGEPVLPTEVVLVFAYQEQTVYSVPAYLGANDYIFGAPVVTSVDPASGPLKGGNEVRIWVRGSRTPT